MYQYHNNDLQICSCFFCGHTRKLYITPAIIIVKTIERIFPIISHHSILIFHHNMALLGVQPHPPQTNTIHSHTPPTRPNTVSGALHHLPFPINHAETTLTLV